MPRELKTPLPVSMMIDLRARQLLRPRAGGGPQDAEAGAVTVAFPHINLNIHVMHCTVTYVNFQALPPEAPWTLQRKYS